MATTIATTTMPKGRPMKTRHGPDLLLCLSTLLQPTRRELSEHLTGLMGRVVFMPRVNLLTAQGDVSPTAQGEVTLTTVEGEVTPKEMQTWTRHGLQQDLHLICAAC